jgi:hypothetical protein
LPAAGGGASAGSVEDLAELEDAALDLQGEAGDDPPPAIADLVDRDDLGLGANARVDRRRGGRRILLPFYELSRQVQPADCQMIRPGGIFRLWDVVCDFAPREVGERIEAWCATGGNTIEAEWSRAELEEHIRDEHSTFARLLEPMISRSSFEIVHAEHSEDGIFVRYLLRAI